MSKSSIVRTLLAATFVASLCAPCGDNNKDHQNRDAGRIRISGEGTLAEGGSRTDKPNAVDQKSEIGEDCAVVDSTLLLTSSQIPNS